MPKFFLIRNEANFHEPGGSPWMMKDTRRSDSPDELGFAWLMWKYMPTQTRRNLAVQRGDEPRW